MLALIVMIRLIKFHRYSSLADRIERQQVQLPYHVGYPMQRCWPHLISTGCVPSAHVYESNAESTYLPPRPLAMMCGPHKDTDGTPLVTGPPAK